MTNKDLTQTAEQDIAAQDIIETATEMGALPTYIQIAEHISREINAGILLEGQRLPGERDMAKTYQVSVGTLRKSLARLTELGLLERRQGSGNYIKKNLKSATIYSLFRLELRKGGGLPTAQLLCVETMAKPDDLPHFGSADFAHRLRRLRFLDDIPIALEEIWLDGSIADKIHHEQLSQSVYQFCKNEFNLWISHAEDWVGLAPIPDWTPAPFPLKAGTISGFVERFGTAQTNHTIEFSRTWYDSDVARYVARLT